MNIIDIDVIYTDIYTDTYTDIYIDNKTTEITKTTNKNNRDNGYLHRLTQIIKIWHS